MTSPRCWCTADDVLPNTGALCCTSGHPLPLMTRADFEALDAEGRAAAEATTEDAQRQREDAAIAAMLVSGRLALTMLFEADNRVSWPGAPHDQGTVRVEDGEPFVAWERRMDDTEMDDTSPVDLLTGRLLDFPDQDLRVRRVPS